MYARLKISHHRHSGRLQAHEHTSYFPLAFLLVITALVLGVCTAYAASPGPEAGSIGLNGGMPGPPPKAAAVITSPTNQQRFSTSPVTVSGTCEAGTLIEVYKNDIFAGSGVCSDKGTFSFDIDLMIGQNILVAKIYDSLNQPGPDSKPVTVFYDALPAQADPLAALNFGSAQLLLNTDSVYRGVWPKKSFVMPISIIGGTAPYAVNVQWGDSTNKVMPRNDNITFNAEHTYSKPGNFQITLQATDAQGRVAFLTVAAIVNGTPSGAAAAATTDSGSNTLMLLWPILASAVAIVLGFWLGERREKHLLTRPAPVYRPQS